jgi:hypothetical protein
LGAAALTAGCWLLAAALLVLLLLVLANGQWVMDNGE